MGSAQALEAEQAALSRFAPSKCRCGLAARIEVQYNQQYRTWTVVTSCSHGGPNRSATAPWSHVEQFTNVDLARAQPESLVATRGADIGQGKKWEARMQVNQQVVIDVEAGGTIGVGDQVALDPNGRAVAYVPGTRGEVFIGVAQTTAVLGGTVKVEIGANQQVPPVATPKKPILSATGRRFDSLPATVRVGSLEPGDVIKVGAERRVVLSRVQKSSRPVLWKVTTRRIGDDAYQHFEAGDDLASIVVATAVTTGGDPDRWHEQQQADEREAARAAEEMKADLKRRIQARKEALRQAMERGDHGWNKRVVEQVAKSWLPAAGEIVALACRRGAAASSQRGKVVSVDVASLGGESMVTIHVQLLDGACMGQKVNLRREEVQPLGVVAAGTTVREVMSTETCRLCGQRAAKYDGWCAECVAAHEL